LASSYTTRSGDTWDAIAYRAFADQLKGSGVSGEKYMDLMIEANPTHNYVAMFGDGVVLVVPSLPAPSRPASLPPWRRQ
jgi:phage tail protein X